MAEAKKENPTTTEQEGPKLPQKRFFRQRAHVNIFNDVPLDYPINPDEEDWSKLYPTYFRPHADKHQAASDAKRPHSPSVDGPTVAPAKRGPAATAPVEDSLAKVEFADIGCGYGGLLVALAPLYPTTLMVGMEIRTKLVDYLQQRIEALRGFQRNLLAQPGTEWVDVNVKLAQEVAALSQPLAGTKESHDTGETERLVPGHYENIAAMRINCQKYLPNFFKKGQLSKMFVLFADPHFKRRKHKARIISQTMLAEYAYVMKTGGIIYMITDVEDLYNWSLSHLDDFPLFERIPNDEILADPVTPFVINSTEEGKKVARNNGKKYLACYRRIEDPDSSEAV
ncbi:tRNA (guanine-N(7)-)-methyltransferase (tRNA(m7G46)-methyltransferase) [Coemansia sp. RSA 2611]|uniref:tRNA (Guanine-N(7)-)-methyltransferase (tRNA(m7G46)-methyltransferase) n=1 Tax=Coemansia linderi TaxID=2663919 RepID=A0ACC1KAZ6_9FUNG|nr:tRNA (guanine-N(7)-)-methyltransferase (tRNA(m7G46)-methyltransferase) [Coemansia sp. RSA 2611]KAJ2698170.1 tRNA (guanine-N(7)-)-methyltransferase (tRNA(m7G46)-methyltransferase) [Coemansia sp. IMI 209128]KAJ2779885.1 tRNA (guanine-N(7)-)-methyltransferase (tRNA(m7G46)-methyltransferase) [Coemansia linderi]